MGAAVGSASGVSELSAGTVVVSPSGSVGGGDASSRLYMQKASTASRTTPMTALNIPLAFISITNSDINTFPLTGQRPVAAGTGLCYTE